MLREDRYAATRSLRLADPRPAIAVAQNSPVCVNPPRFTLFLWLCYHGLL